MRSLAATAVVLAALLAAAPAGAAQSLSHATAARYANRAAANRARSQPAITDWEIVRGFRFESRKWVFVWDAQISDGRVCSAQLVTRYASRTSRKVVAYFRNESCS
jgi:curli biogenesis system outer membrane secretion channel CsgG